MRVVALLSFAFSCVVLGCSSSDAAGGAVDGGTDGAADVARSDATDATRDALLACPAPLTDEAAFDDPPLASWCTTKSNGLGARSTKACDGYLALIIGEGVDCSGLFLFDPSSKALVAELHGCNFHYGCMQGPPGFVPPSTACLQEGGFAFASESVCRSDAGVDASSDAAGD
jgi:hypothetical protein